MPENPAGAFCRHDLQAGLAVARLLPVSGRGEPDLSWVIHDGTPVLVGHDRLPCLTAERPGPSLRNAPPASRVFGREPCRLAARCTSRGTARRWSVSMAVAWSASGTPLDKLFQERIDTPEQFGRIVRVQGGCRKASGGEEVQRAALTARRHAGTSSRWWRRAGGLFPSRHQSRNVSVPCDRPVPPLPPWDVVPMVALAGWAALSLPQILPGVFAAVLAGTDARPNGGGVLGPLRKGGSVMLTRAASANNRPLPDRARTGNARSRGVLPPAPAPSPAPGEGTGQGALLIGHTLGPGGVEEA
jgi:hypothetical protein